MPVILEGLVTTRNADGSVHLAPMGPVVEPDMRTLVLKPFLSSTTWSNLYRARQGVFHVTDDVLLLARAAIGCIETPPEVMEAQDVDGAILASACRWYAFRVVAVDAKPPRATMQAQVVGSGRLRDFFGFNRAKHAVVEAAILASRIHLIPKSVLEAELDRLQSPVVKTGGEQEHNAMALLRDYIESHGAIDASGSKA